MIYEVVAGTNSSQNQAIQLKMENQMKNRIEDYAQWKPGLCSGLRGLELSTRYK